MAYSWDTLPFVIIIKILSFLEPTDRVAAASICSHWSEALQTPFLWRNITVKLIPLSDTYLKIDIMSQLAQAFGKHMRRLELVWKCPKRIFGGMSEAYGVNYLNILVSEVVQVKTLVLTHWDCSYKSTNRNRIVKALNKFLSLQFGMEELSLMNANMRRHEILRLLSSVAHNSIHLKHLDLRSAFRGWQSPYPAPQYLLIIGSFPCLINLQVDYRSLCDAVLEIMSTTLLSLKYLEVNICPADTSLYRHLAISDRAWLQLKNSCPNLEVSFVIMSISHFEDICCFLLPNVPLYNFTFYSGTLCDDSRSRNFRRTGNLLISYYHNSLTDLRLHLRNNRELMDDILLDIIKYCRRLKNLQFDGVIHNLGILPSICSMVLEDPPRFKTIRFSPRILNPRNNIVIQNMVFEYKKKLSARNIDFSVDDLFPIVFT